MDLNHDRLCIRQVLSTRLSYRSFWWAGVEFAPPQLAASLLQSVGLTRAQPTHMMIQVLSISLVPLAGAAPTLDVWKTPALLLRYSGIMNDER